MTCGSLTQQSAVQWTKQKNALGLSYENPGKFEASGAGAANGTTIVVSTLASTYTTSDDLIGMLVEVVYTANGPVGERGAPIRRRIMDYSSASNTITIEALPWQVSDGDSFCLLNPPNPWWSNETGGSTSKIVDGDRNEADDYWVGAAEKGGPYLTILYGTTLTTGINALITDFSTTAGAVYASLGMTTAIGDLAEAWEYPEIFGGNPLTFNQPRLTRETVSGTKGRPRGTANLVEVSGSHELAFRGPGRSRIGEATEIDTPLGAICDAAAVSDFVSDTGGSISQVVVKSGSPAKNEIFCADNGDCFVASAVSGANVTPSPSLRYALTEDVNVYGLRKYNTSDALNYACAIKQWHGKESFDVLWGCAPNFKVEGNRGEYVKFMLDWQGTDGYRVYLDQTNAAYSRPYNPKLPTIVPRALGDSRAVVDAVEFELRKFTIDLGIDIQPSVNLAAPNAMDGFCLINDHPSGTLELYLEADGRQITDKWLYGKPMTLLIQAGKHPGEPGVFAFWAYEIEVMTVDYTDDAGAIVATVNWEVTLDSTEQTLDRWMIGIG